jgi:DNA modification methylase
VFVTARLIIGDSLAVTRTLEAGSVDLIVTSPPFLALRSYLPADHADKAKEMGSEATPGAFIDALLDLTEEWARVLAPHGSICVELGDTYSGSGGAGGDYGWDRLGARGDQDDQPPNYRRKGQVFEGAKRQSDRGTGWPMAKSLTMIPELYRIALAYGVNPLTGRQTDRWRVRNVVRWHRPNPPVGSLGDKFRPSTSDMVIACKSSKRYFDLDSVRNGPNDRTHERSMTSPKDFAAHEDGQRGKPTGAPMDPNGAPPLDTWVIPTAPYKGSHYATFPPDLVVRPIKAMCPERVCRTCGEPSRRIVGDAEYVKPDGALHEFHGDEFETNAAMANRRKVTGADNGNMSRQAPTLGWTDCDCSDDRNPSMGLAGKWRPGVVLDPFAGSGTTLAVATGHGRDAIGIDLDERNANLCRERVGMFLEVVSSQQ